MSKSIEWMYINCGKRKTKLQTSGRPQPGKYPRKTGDKPHTWTKNRTIG